MNFSIKTILLIVLGFAIVALADEKKNEPKEITLPKIIIPAPKKETERKKVKAIKQNNSPLIQKQQKQTEFTDDLRTIKQIDFT
ncbi:MAG: hypothetical protein GXO75_13570 [Calditrichaeota bacterium]|nr:hypothetical protein [Calditrichota bacterium]